MQLRLISAGSTTQKFMRNNLLKPHTHSENACHVTLRRDDRTISRLIAAAFSISAACVASGQYQPEGTANVTYVSSSGGLNALDSQQQWRFGNVNYSGSSVPPTQFNLQINSLTDSAGNVIISTPVAVTGYCGEWTKLVSAGTAYNYDWVPLRHLGYYSGTTGGTLPKFGDALGIAADGIGSAKARLVQALADTSWQGSGASDERKAAYQLVHWKIVGENVPGHTNIAGAFWGFNITAQPSAYVGIYQNWPSSVPGYLQTAAGYMTAALNEYASPAASYHAPLLALSGASTGSYPNVFPQDLILRLPETHDYGDLPSGAAFNTAGAGNPANAPRHALGSGLRLGATVDGDLNGRPGQAATGDDTTAGFADDEDGVSFPALFRGTAASLSVQVTGSGGRLSAWIDWNDDGDFADPGETAASGIPMAAGTNSLSVSVPAGAVTTSTVGARFRLSTATGLSASGGTAPDGEIEDYMVQPLEARLALGNTVFRDLNGSGGWDAGEGINGVNVRIYSAGSNGQIGGGDDAEINAGPDGILGTADDAAGGVATSGDGAYLFRNLPAGIYYLQIPASQFGSGGPLQHYSSMTGQGGDTALDDNADENGDDNEADGVASTVIALMPGLAPVGEQGRDSGSSFNAADDSNVNLTVDFGFTYCEPLAAPAASLCPIDKVLLAAPCYVNGDPLAPGSTSGPRDAFVAWPYTTTGTTNETMPLVHLPASQVGSVWGIAARESSRTFYTAAFLKRHCGFGPAGVAGVYRIDLTNPNAPVVTGYDLNALYGINAGTTPRDGTPANALTADVLAPSYDSAAFANVGKISFGGVAVSADGTRLYVMNLHQRQIEVLNLNAAGNITGASAAIPVANPGCPTADFRPFALKVHGSKLLVGTVCSGETGGVATLRSYVQVYDGSRWHTLLTFPMNYSKGGAIASGAAESQWRAWTGAFPGIFPNVEGWASVYCQPVLSDIEVDNDGSLILGYFDRFGHQMGYGNYRPDPLAADTTLYQAVVGGDILRAAYNPATECYALESAGDVPGTAGPTAGAANNQGPGGGEYYWGEMFGYNDGNSSDGYHQETSNGGLAFVPGRGEVVLSAMDPLNLIDAGGILKLSNVTGGRVTSMGSNGSYQLYYRNPGTFAKAAGIGDVSAICAESPEVGNFVWCDQNANGIQDSGEPGIAGVKVQIYTTSGVLTGETYTDGSGFYEFAWGLSPSTGYRLFIPAGQAALSGKIPAPAGQGTAATDSSTATVEPAGIVQLITTPAGSGVDHTWDFGFAPGYSLGNLVWLDTDRDGLRDTAEPALPNVKVELRSGTTVVQAAFTDCDGYYRFDGLTADSYTVCVSGENWSGLTGAGALNGTSPLLGYLSSPGSATQVQTSGTAAVDAVDHGIDRFNPLADGICSHPVTVGPANQPVSEPGSPAVCFDGTDDKVTLPAGNYNTDTLTMAAWVKLNGAQDDWDGILVGRGGAGSATGLFIRPGNTLGYMWGDQFWGTPTGLVLPVDEWVHVSLAVERQKAVVTMVRASGVSSFTNVGIHNPLSFSWDMAAGHDPGHAGRYLSGCMDDVRIFTRTLGAGEIQSLATGGAPAGLVDHWKLDETSGTVAANCAAPLRAGSYSGGVLLNQSSGAVTSAGGHGLGGTAMDNLAVDFGFSQFAWLSVGNLVFSDLNNDGNFDAGVDAGIPGVNVLLYSPGPDNQIGGGDDYEIAAGPDGILGTADDAAGGVTTDSGGCYLFQGLPPGSYYVSVPIAELEAGGPLHGYYTVSGQGGDTLSDDDADENGGAIGSDGVLSTVITLSHNSEPVSEAGKDAATAVNAADDDNVNLTVDFGFVAPAAITGSVYEDTDNNGSGDLLLDQEAVTLTLCTDLNGDGDSDDAGEGAADNPNLAGAQDYVITTSDGTYAFTGLLPGSYVVKETQPAGYLTVTDLDSTADAVSSPADAANASSTDNLLAATVGGGETDSGNDFVEELTASISVTIYADTNNDNAGDVVINVVTLTLCTDLNGDGDSDDAGEGAADNPNLAGVQDYEITTMDGTYRFSGLAPGSYVVKETQPSGYLTVTDLDSDPDELFSPADAANASGLDDLISVTLAGGEEDLGNDFVEEQPAAISGTINADTNNDNAGDVAIDVVTLILCTDLNGDGDSDDAGEGPADDPNLAGVQAYEITTTDGTYLFSGLPPGSYVVKETQPAGYLTVTDLDSLPDAAGSPPDAANSSIADDLLPVTVQAGETDAGNDFVEEQPAAISGKIYADTNNDNIGDSLINVVTLTLCTDLNGDGDSDDAGEGPADDPNQAGVQDYEITTTDGTYLFSGLAPGSYVVKETQPAGYLTVTDLDSDTDFAGSPPDAGNVSGTDDLIPVTLLAGETDSGNDFVEEEPAAILGAVYADTDNDNIGDSLISVVTLTLCADLNGDGDSDDAGEGPADNPNEPGIQDYVITTTDGTYAFSGLTPGSYVVKETQPVGYINVSDLDSAEDDAGSPPDAANASITDNLLAVTVGAGETDGGNDFVERMTVGVGNLVYIDMDGDSVYTAGVDRAVGGVTVNAYADADADGAPDNSTILGSDVTDSSGRYLIDGLLPGRFVLHIPASMFSAGPLAGTVSVPGAGGDDAADDAADENGVDAPFPGLSGIYSASIELQPGTEPGAVEGETAEDAASDDARESAVDLTVDFAFKGQLILGGQVRYDGDQDGNLADPDSPLEGFIVRLYRDENTNGSFDDGTDVLLRTQVTATDGTYSFDCLPDGTYVVTVTPPDLVIRNTNDRDGNNNRTIPVILAGSDSPGNDFLETVDPQGWFYDVETCQVVPGGLVEVNSMPAGGGVVYVKTGVDGEYAWLTNGVGGTYTMTLTLPPGYMLAPQPEYQPQLGTFDAPAGPGTVIMGSGISASGSMLNDCTGASNPWYLAFELHPGDQSVIHNNIPLIRTKPVTFPGWQALNPLGGENGGTQNPEGDDWSNLEEFAYCFNPRSGVRECALEIIARPDGTLAACQRRASGLVGVTFSLAYIGDLNSSGSGGAGWSILPDAPTSVTDNGDGTETACWEDVETLTGLTGGQGFLSSVVSADLNGDLDTSDPGETAWSPVLGWMDHTLEIGCETVSLPFEDCPILVAEVAGGSSGSLNVSGALNGLPLALLVGGGSSYYIDVTSGPHTGHRFAVNEAASTGASLILEVGSPHSTLAPLPDLTGAHIILREFKTLGAQFPAQDYHAGTGASTADYVLVFEGGSWVTYYLLDIDDQATGDELWVRAGMGFADQSGKLLDPGQGMFVHRRQTAMVQTQLGMVRETAFRSPLSAGCSLVSNPWPVSASVQDRALLNPSSASSIPFTGGLSVSRADQVLLWTGDATPGLASYSVYFYARTATRNHYTVGGDVSLPNVNADALFLPLHSQCLCLQAAHPDYVMPLPWTPPSAP